jgi:hypothetical protein
MEELHGAWQMERWSAFRNPAAGPARKTRADKNEEKELHEESDLSVIGRGEDRFIGRWRRRAIVWRTNRKMRHRPKGPVRAVEAGVVSSK